MGAAARLTTVALVDDDPPVLDLWQRQLVPRAGFQCIGTCADA